MAIFTPCNKRNKGVKKPEKTSGKEWLEHLSALKVGGVAKGESIAPGASQKNGAKISCVLEGLSQGEGVFV